MNIKTLTHKDDNREWNSSSSENEDDDGQEEDNKSQFEDINKEQKKKQELYAKVSQNQLEKITYQISKEKIQEMQDNCISEKDKFYIIQDMYIYYDKNGAQSVKYHSIRPKLPVFTNLKRYTHAALVWALTKQEKKYEHKEDISWKEIKYNNEYFEEIEPNMCSNCLIVYKETKKQLNLLAQKRAHFIKYVENQEQEQNQELSNYRDKEDFVFDFENKSQ